MAFEGGDGRADAGGSGGLPAPKDGGDATYGATYEAASGAVTGSQPAYESGGGCLVVAVRMPVRLVAFAVVLPLRLLWDALAAVGRALGAGARWVGRRLLLPPLRALGAALARVWRTLVVVPAVFLAKYLVALPLVLLWRYVAVPVGRGVARAVRVTGEGIGWVVDRLVVLPLTALYRHVLTPAGHALAWLARHAGTGLGLGATWLGHWLLVVPARALWRHVLVPAARAVAAAVTFLVRYAVVAPAVALWRYVIVPVGRGMRWTLRTVASGCARLLRVLLVIPAVFVWRKVLLPVGREVAAALGHAWRAAGYVSRAVGRGLKWLFRVLVAAPLSWVWRHTGAPAVRGLRAAGRWSRRVLWAPVREAVAEARRTLRQLRADTRRALFGTARAEPVRVPKTGESPDAAPDAPRLSTGPS